MIKVIEIRDPFFNSKKGLLKKKVIKFLGITIYCIETQFVLSDSQNFQQQNKPYGHQIIW